MYRGITSVVCSRSSNSVSCSLGSVALIFFGTTYSGQFFRFLLKETRIYSVSLPTRAVAQTLWVGSLHNTEPT